MRCTSCLSDYKLPWHHKLYITAYLAFLALGVFALPSASASPHCISPTEFEAELEFAPGRTTYSHPASSHLGKHLIQLYIHQVEPKYPGLFTAFTGRIQIHLFPDRSLITYIFQGKPPAECLLGYLGLSRDQLLWFLNSIDNNI